MADKFVSYLRVSTDRQGRSGLEPSKPNDGSRSLLFAPERKAGNELMI